MALEIRTITDAEFVSWTAVKASAFFNDGPLPEVAEYRRPLADLDRTWAAFDGAELVATLRSFATELTVPGGAIIGADAVTNVTTRATHRRRGALTGMMTESLAAAAERGDPVSILVAARWPIYGRYGYGPAIEIASYAIDTGLAGFLGQRSDRLTYVDAAAARGAADGVFDAFRRRQPGAISRAAHQVDAAFSLSQIPGEDPWKGYCVLHHDGTGQPDGYLRYHVDDKWDVMVPASTLVVDDLVAATPQAYQALWRLCCEMDNVTTVTAGDRSVDEPLRWLLTDGRAVSQRNRSDFIWPRVLDVAAALSARRYLTEGSVVLEVSDPQGYAAGRWRLDGGPDGASCCRTDKTADLTVSAYALGAAYLGGTRLRDLALGGQVTEHVTGALARADATLRPELTPWCNTWF